jgi:phosphatidylinositol alpha-1,6-mannosyltransferase
VAQCVKSFSSVPYLLYAHGEEILISRSSEKLRFLSAKVYGSAAAIIANSHHTKALLEDVGVRSEKIHVIYPGVDPENFRANREIVLQIRQRYNLGESPVLLTVGRLQRRKGQDMVIRALPHILRKFPTVKYIIAGTGEEASSLQQLAYNVGVGEKVIFAGYVPDSEQGAYYAACDVFVMPNRQIGPDIEGFGMVFLEAGAAGKPVIGGRSGGTGEAIIEGKTGLRIDGTDIEEIATAVRTLLADPARAQAMGEAGRRRVEEEFNWETVVQRTRLLSSAVAEKRV